MTKKQTGKTLLRMVYEQLVEDQKVKNQNEFSTSIGFNSVATSQMLKGSKPLNVRLLKNLYNVYGVNIHYLLSGGKGTIYADAENGDLSRKVEEFKSLIIDYVQKIEHLKKVVADKEKIIELYQMLNNEKDGAKEKDGVRG